MLPIFSSTRGTSLCHTLCSSIGAETLHKIGVLLQYNPREVLLGTEMILHVPCEWLWDKAHVRYHEDYDPYKNISAEQLNGADQDDVFVCSRQLSLLRKVGISELLSTDCDWVVW